MIMRYLILTSVKNEDIEAYIKSTNNLKIPGVELIQSPHILYQSVDEARCITILETEYITKVLMFCQSLKPVESITLTALIESQDALEKIEKFESEKKKTESEYQKAEYPKLDIRSTNKLEILPLVDWRNENTDLQTEVGVSYLIRTDESTILFDLGFNMVDTHPSPLLNNMEKLGVSVDEIHSIFITHQHSDHVGGGKWIKDNTFSLSGEQIPLDVKVYTPVKMTYPGLEPIYSPNPFILGKGMASIGTISTAMFNDDIAKEMGIAVNVAGKGIVLIIGCGHQSLRRILERYKMLFDEPLYGIVGGLHYPVEGGPVGFYGYYPHIHLGTGKLPWDPISVDELMENIDLLRSFNPELVAISPHDSSPFSLNAFQKAFPGVFKEVIVGNTISI